jgi:hypothetical protein
MAADIRRGDKSVGGGIGVVAGREVAVVRRHDAVLFALLLVLTIPLPDARATGVGQDKTPKLAEHLHSE